MQNDVCFSYIIIKYNIMIASAERQLKIQVSLIKFCFVLSYFKIFKFILNVTANKDKVVYTLSSVHSLVYTILSVTDLTNLF